MKFSVWPIVRDHYATLRNDATGLPRPLDYIEFLGLPAALAVGCGVADVRLHELVSVGLLTVSGLLAAFLFQVMLQASQRALDWADSAPPPGPATSRHAKFMGELAANSGYASLVSIAACTAFVITSVISRAPLRIFTAIGLALALHLALVLLMVLRRVYALTQNRLTEVETGAAASRNVTPLTPRSRAS